MLTPEDLLDIALQMQAAHDRVEPLEPLTSLHSDFDLPAAYQVAETMHRLRLERGAQSVGRKIGFTNYDMWDLYGVREPIWAFVYDRTVTHTGVSPAQCSIAKFREPKIEPELVFHFHATPPLGASATALLEYVDWVALGFEVVQSHFPGWKFRAADTVADCSLHAALFVGQHHSPGDLGPGLAAALERFSVKLYCDGALRDQGTGANVLGSPLNAIAHLMSVLSKQPQFPPLQAGELVSTGTITTAQTVQSGQTWHAELVGMNLGRFSLSFTG